MNGKLAKKIRRSAELASVGSPKRDYVVFRQGGLIIGQDGLPIGRKPDALRLSGDCTRGLYLIIKRLRRRHLRARQHQHKQPKSA
jgi:hypothetical protein